ncbi:MAG TPA: sugar phosphate isomerase/epimerase [Puia sp.]|nr:sugar phosphate isomerase/epimerase [Puia sp.]
MTSRRVFIKSASALSAAVFVKGPLNAFAANPVIGLQLYTVRDAMGTDPLGTLQKVAQIGYNSVENATYTGSEKFYGMDAATYKKVLNENGLVANSGHYRLGEEQEKGADVQGTILHDWQRAVDDASAVGLKYMVCAYLSNYERGDLDHYKKLADIFNKAGETCKKSGIQFCYHNHDFEFQVQNGVFPYDVLLEKTDKNNVKMEVDLYWIKKAGQDPLALFQKHPGRFPLWHVKDMSKEADQSFAAVGTGIIDFKTIFQHKDQAGMKYFFVEQDKCPGSPFESIAQSYKFIKTNLV